MADDDLIAVRARRLAWERLLAQTDTSDYVATEATAAIRSALTPSDQTKEHPA